MALSFLAGYSRKCVIYSIAAVILLLLIILMNLAYLPGRRFTIRKNINDSTSSKASIISTISTSSSTKATSRPNTIEPKVPTKRKYQTLSCSKHKRNQINMQQQINTSSRCYSPKDPSICHSDPVHCEHPLPSATKRGDRNWPRYGEYSYLPQKKWILVTLHGGVVFLYHPCANATYVDGLRSLAKSCLQRYVLAPYERLHQPIAMVTWGCYFYSNHLNWSVAQNWIKEKALRAPASHVYWNGDFKEGLLEPSSVVTDLKETHLCPTKNTSVKSSMLVISKKKPSLHSSTRVSADDASWNNGHVFVIVASHYTSTERQKFDSVNAAWALGSVVFLCLILVVVMAYTKPWEHRQDWWRTDMYDSNTKFSLMKSKRYPVKTDWRGKSRSKNLVASQARPLLGSIPEEIDDVYDDV